MARQVIEVFLIALAVAVLCSSAPMRKTNTYSCGSIIRMDPDTLERTCADTAGHYDDGTVRQKWDPVTACAYVNEREIFVEDDCLGAEAIPHELAHLDGHANPDSEGYDWR